MKKRFLSVVLALALCVGLAIPVFAAESDFVIENGVLTKYNGPGGNVTIPNSVTEIGYAAFYNCSDLTSVTIPSGVTSIGESAFKSCSSLTSVTIPISVTRIMRDAFLNCTSLTSTTIPNSVTYIGDNAFKGCTSLTSVTISNGVTQIGYCAFSGCVGLTSITIPNKVTKIRLDAFEGCTGLTSVTIPNSVTQIGHSAFSGCTGLIDVYYSGTEAQWKAITIDDGNEKLINATIHYIPSVTTTTWSTGSTGGTRNSGSTAMTKLDKQEIVQLLSDNPLTLPDNVFVTEPSISNPYAPGKVKEEVLQATVNRLNALRRIAGLPPVELDMALCENAQYGAVIIAAMGKLDHTPTKPSDMTEAFYKEAYAATSSSNLHAGVTLTKACDGFMDDSDVSNIDRLGHRRWQLNPTMGKVGFGYAQNPKSLYGQYVAEKVLDTSGADCDYDFIGWPASGNFPSNLFDPYEAWSVSLNPTQYQTPKRSELTVTLTRKTDGKFWSISDDNYFEYNSGHYLIGTVGSENYFNVDTGGYGISNCIIFRPEGTAPYEGVYTVKIDGLKTKSGQAVTDFTYEVNFFDVNKGDLFTDLDWSAPSANWAAEKGIASGIGDNLFGPTIECNHAMILTFLWRAAGNPTSSTVLPINIAGKNLGWAEQSLRWAAQKGMINRTFDPLAPCTRADAVSYIWQAFDKPGAGASSFVDVSANADYAVAVNWAVANGITNGTSTDTFSPDNICTRGEIVTFLHRAYVPKVR